jgi:undecaprenyl-diphosphatase
MNWAALVPALVLGLVEGATEFIPVSSTGHLILVQNLLGFIGKKENAFAIFIQLGAILAVVWLYRKKILRLVLNWKTLPESRRLWVNLFIGTLPAVIVGLPTERWIETHFFKPFPVSLALIAGGFAILLVERFSRHPDVEHMDHIPVKKAMGVGIIQVLAIIFPGVSRSGATIMGGMALGLSRKAATEFSFFLAIPAMLGATLVKMAGAYETIVMSDLPVFAVGFGVSFVSALVVIKGVLAFVSKNSFAPFALYRILLGMAILALFRVQGGVF